MVWESERAETKCCYAYYVNLLGENINNITNPAEILLQISKIIGIEINTAKTKYINFIQNKNQQQSQSHTILCNKSHEKVTKFMRWEWH